MTERPEIQPQGRSWMPLAMAGAFAVGAAVAGWFIFSEDIKAWSRIEDIAWQPSPGERLALEQHDRWRISITEQPDQVLDAHFTWTVIPVKGSRVPGDAVTWAQVLREARVEHRVGDTVDFAGAWTEAPPPEDAEPLDFTPVPSWVGLLEPVMGVDVGGHLATDAIAAASATAPEALEQIATRQSGKAIEERDPLSEDQAHSLQAQLVWLVQNVAADVTGGLGMDLTRPGQTWVRETTLDFGPWGSHGTKLELRHTGYDGDLAKWTAVFSRLPTEEALNPDDGLSGLKGDADFHFTVSGHHLQAGRMHLEARGKIDRKFATILVDRTFALSGPSGAPALPPEWAIGALPPPAPAEAAAVP